MRILSILFFYLLSFPLFGQHKIIGTITDSETNETLIGASIYFPDLYKGTTSSLDGGYSLVDLPQGNFNIEYSFIGYKSVILHIHLLQDTTINISLKPDLKEMKEVIVTGVSKSTELKVSPVPAVITTRKDLFEFQATNLIDGIANQPGIDQITTGPAISKPIIRGLGSNRVLTLYNGLRAEGQQWGDEHGIEIDEFSIDKVEIIKGPGSIAYGSDAMAGVINFLTPHEVAEGSITGSVDAGYQTNNNQYNISGGMSGNLNGFNWRGRVSGKQAGNFKNGYDGKIFNSGFNEFDWDAEIGLNKSWGFSHFYTSSFSQHIGLVEGERDSQGNFTKQTLDSNGQTIEEVVSEDDLQGYKIFIPNQRVRHFRIGTSNQFYIGKSSLMVKADYQINQREEFANILIPNEQQLYFKLKTFTYALNYYLPDYKHWETSVGVNGMSQNNANLGVEVLIPEYNLFDFGVYMLTQKQFDKFMVSGGIRYDNRYINSYQLIVNEGGVPKERFSAFTKNFSNVTGSIGASYRPDEIWNFKLNFARGFRAPTLAELSSNGIHEGSFRYEYGSLTLDPETSLQTDLGIDIETEHSTIQLAAFFNHIDNYIYLQKLLDSNGNDSIPDPIDGSIAFQYVQGAANLYGFEAGIDLHPHPFDWLHFENTISLVYTKQLNQPDSSKYLPFIPAPKFKSELRANLPSKGHVFSESFIKLEWVYHFEQNRILSAYNTETTTPDYSLINAGAGTTFKNSKGEEILSLVLLANNIFDLSYQSHLSRLKYAPDNPATGRSGVFNMGRSFMVKVKVPLRLK